MMPAEEGHPSHHLGMKAKVAYALPRGTTQAMGLLLQTTVRSLVYVEAFGMAPKTMAMLIACAKSFDLIIGFVVGHTSDHCNTRGATSRRHGARRRRGRGNPHGERGQTRLDEPGGDSVGAGRAATLRRPR